MKPYPSLTQSGSPTAVEEGDILTVELERVPLSNCKLRPIPERPSSSGWLVCDGIDPLYLPIKPDGVDEWLYIGTSRMQKQNKLVNV